MWEILIPNTIAKIIIWRTKILSFLGFSIQLHSLILENVLKASASKYFQVVVKCIFSRPYFPMESFHPQVLMARDLSNQLLFSHFHPQKIFEYFGMSQHASDLLRSLRPGVNIMHLSKSFRIPVYNYQHFTWKICLLLESNDTYYDLLFFCYIKIIQFEIALKHLFINSKMWTDIVSFQHSYSAT